MLPGDPQISWGYVVPPLLGFLVLLGLALISLLRGAGRRANLLFSGLSFLGALLNADMVLVSVLPDADRSLQVDRAVHLAFVFSVPVYICFVHAFLGIRDRRWLEAAAWLFSSAFLPAVPTDLYFAGIQTYPFGRIARAGPLFHLFSAAATFAVGYALFLLWNRLRHVEDNLQKNRIKYVLGGLGGSAFLLALTMLPVCGVPVYPMGNFSFLPALFLAVGVLKYDLLDIGFVLRRGTAYFLLTGLLTILYVLVIWLFQILFAGAAGRPAVALSLVLALSIVLLFNPLRALVQRLIDRLFFRGRYDYHEVLREISGRLASLLNQRQIRALLAGTLTRTLQVERLLLLMAEAGGYRLYSGQEEVPETLPPPTEEALIRWFQAEGRREESAGIHRAVSISRATPEIRPAFGALAAALIVPIGPPERLAGLLILGQKRSGELFVEEDLALLATVANQAATAIQNALSYEALAEVNRHLEEKVTERTAALREALAERERTQAQLIRSESLAAIGQLVAGTAHELNNPIAGAMSLVQTSLEAIETSPWQTVDWAEVAEDLHFSLKELRRAGQIIRSLLDLSRQTQTYVEAVEVNRAVDDALRVLHNRFKGHPVEVRKAYQEGLPTVEGNFANLGQVLINVLLNAFQALPGSRGTITLTTGTSRNGAGVFVACRDTGVGIPEASLKDIFKPFFTTKAVGQGTGLGLYISHEIVRRHGGEIRVESREGEGTVVTIDLPCNRREP